MRKEIIQMTRDRRTVIITFIQPILMLFLLGSAATSDVRNVPAALFDQDHSQAARDLLDAYRAADYFRFSYQVQSVAEMQKLIDSGAAKAGLIIPPDYGKRIAANEPAQVAFVIDGSDATLASTALSAATLIGQSKSTAVLRAQLDARGQSTTSSAPIEVRTQVWYNPDLVQAYFMIPGLMGTILLQLAVMLTASSIVRERERGTIEQLIITPIRSWELVVGKLTPYVFLAFFDMLEVLVIGTLAFHVPMNGNLGLLLLMSALFLATGLGIGLFISTVAKTQQEAQMLSALIQLPSFFLAGFFFPIAAMPPFLQALSYLVPLRYFLTIVRAIMLKGAGVEAFSGDLIALAIFCVVIMALAVRRFRKRLD
ncbi:MAG: ABC transporter permease [Anaerolineae bacterium]